MVISERLPSGNESEWLSVASADKLGNKASKSAFDIEAKAPGSRSEWSSIRDVELNSLVAEDEDGIADVDGIVDVEADIDIVAEVLRELESDPMRALPRALEGLRDLGSDICCSTSDAGVRSITLLDVPPDGVDVVGIRNSE